MEKKLCKDCKYYRTGDLVYGGRCFRYPDEMKYKAVPLEDGSFYLVGIPESATEEIDYRDKIILELQNKIEHLENKSSNSDYVKLPNTVTYIQCQHEYGYVSTTAFMGYKCKKCGYTLT